MMPDKNKPEFLSNQAYLREQLAQHRPARLAVRVALDFAQDPDNIAQKLIGFGAEVGRKMKAAFERGLANISERSEAIATALTFAEINRLPPTEQAAMVVEGRDATIVAEAAVRQRRVAPEVQAALVANCGIHTRAMELLASRADATVETLAALTDSHSQRVRLKVAENIGARMRVNEPSRTQAKQAVFDRLVDDFVSDYAPYLVPVCRDPDQLASMYAKTGKTLGVVDVFVDNPHSPDSVLVDISTSPKMHVVQNNAARKAKEMLLVRAAHHESTANDMAPS